MRELNQFNKIVLEKFASRQAYANIKGHYIPIVMGNISDESVMDVEKRKYYIQSYEFIMLGFLIDENEFTVSPAVSRVIQIVEPDLKSKSKKEKFNPYDIKTEPIIVDYNFEVGITEQSHTFDYTCNLSLFQETNIDDYDVYINDMYYGNNITPIQVNTNDVVKIQVNKSDSNLSSLVTFQVYFI